MPIRLAKFTKKEKITIVSLSNAWFTSVPWTHKGKNVKYFAKHENVSDCGNVHFTYWYIGPIGIITGKWVER